MPSHRPTCIEYTDYTHMIPIHIILYAICRPTPLLVAMIRCVDGSTLCMSVHGAYLYIVFLLNVELVSDPSCLYFL